MMMNGSPKHIAKYPQKGFSLIEAAIVLGVVGLVIGGIWVAASAVNSQMKVNRADLAIEDIFSGLDALYAGRTLTASTDYTPLLIASGAIKSDLILNGSAQNPWGGFFSIRTPYPGIGTIIRITLSGVATGDCAKFIIRAVGVVDENGLGRHSMYTININGALATPAVAYASGFSVFANQVTTRCATTSPASVWLEYQYPKSL